MKKIFFTILAFILGIALGIGIMYMSNNDLKNNNKKEEKDSKYVSLKIEDDNCINTNENNYYLSDYDYSAGISIELENSRTVNLTISDLDSWGLTNYNSNAQSFTINNFSEDIIDIRIVSIFPAVDGFVVVFLMEDGSVEYMPVYKVFENNGARSYGKLEGVEDIVKLYNVSAIPKNSPTGATTTLLAQKADGTFYDLEPIIYVEFHNNI